MTLLSEMRKLAKSVNYRYIFGGSRYPGYDCSGSLWAALKALDPLGMKTVNRFYTWNMVSALASRNCGGIIKRISGPEPDAIVLWDHGSEGHVGVCIDHGDRYFSFYNTREGAKTYDISATLRAIRPTYYRYTPAKHPAPKPNPTPPKPHPVTPQAGNAAYGTVYWDKPFKIGATPKPLPTKGSNLWTFTSGAGDYSITATCVVSGVSGGVTVRLVYQDFNKAGKPVGPVHGLGAQSGSGNGCIQVTCTKHVGSPAAGLQRRFRVLAWAGKSATVTQTTVNWLK